MKRFLGLTLAMVALPALCPDLRGDTFQVTVDTSPLLGVNGFLAFDLLAGGFGDNNTATVSSFQTNGALGSSSTSGAVSGSLVPGPLVLDATDFFNEWLQTFQFGSSLSFRISLTTNFSGGAPDEFSFFLLDANLLPFPTSDPTGADALFVIDMNGAPLEPDVFASSFATAVVEPVVEGVPEPGTLGGTLLALSCLLAAGLRNRV